MGIMQNPNPYPYTNPNNNPSTHSNSHSNQSLSSGPRSPSFDEVSKLFNLPLSDAAESLGVCQSVLKKVCYDNGLVRWPYRKVLSGKSIEEIKNDAAIQKKKQIAQLPKVDALPSSAVSPSLGSPLQNKRTVSPQEISKLRTLPQHGTQNFQESTQDTRSSNLKKGNVNSFDEFKYGFPSEGLSRVSNRWWGNKSSDVEDQQDDKDAKDGNQQSKELVDDAANLSSSEDERSKRKRDDRDVDAQWAGSLSALRKKAVKEGQQALKLGVYRRESASKLRLVKKPALLQIFKSSLPSQWSDGAL